MTKSKLKLLFYLRHSGRKEMQLKASIVIVLILIVIGAWYVYRTSQSQGSAVPNNFDMVGVFTIVQVPCSASGQCGQQYEFTASNGQTYMLQFLGSGVTTTCVSGSSTIIFPPQNSGSSGVSLPPPGSGQVLCPTGLLPLPLQGQRIEVVGIVSGNTVIVTHWTPA
jgi:hypothetical protein